MLEWLDKGEYKKRDLLLAIIAGFVFRLILLPGGKEFSKRDAIKHNAAQWVIVDPATGATEFKWNDELTTGGVTR